MAAEVERINGDLKRLAGLADFGLRLLPTARLSTRQQVDTLKDAKPDALVVYASGSGTDVLESLAGLGKPMVIFVREKSGPYCLWHEIVDSRFLRSHTDEVKQTAAGLEDVVVDDPAEVLWRLRALYGLKNTVGRRIVCVGGPGGWSCPQAPERARRRFQLDMVTVPVPEVNALIESARKAAAVVSRCKREARSYMAAHGVTSRIGEDAVAEAFLLKELFRDLMTKNDACAGSTARSPMATGRARWPTRRGRWALKCSGCRRRSDGRGMERRRDFPEAVFVVGSAFEQPNANLDEAAASGAVLVVKAVPTGANTTVGMRESAASVAVGQACSWRSSRLSMHHSFSSCRMRQRLRRLRSCMP